MSETLLGGPRGRSRRVPFTISTRRQALIRASAILVIVCVAGPGCGTLVPFSVNANDPGFELPPTPVMVFYVDGLRKDIFEEMARAGELPLLKRYIIDRAASVDDAV